LRHEAILEEIREAAAVTPSIPAHYTSWLSRHPSIEHPVAIPHAAAGPLEVPLEEEEEEEEEEEACWGLFVYGSLRPDDTSGMPWTRKFVAGMEVQTKATIPGYRLAKVGGYACAIPPAAGEASPSVVCGCVLSCPGDPRRFRLKRKKADVIEGYPKLYQRAVVDAQLTGGGSAVPCYIYYKTPGPHQIEEEIPSGDWLQRSKLNTN